MPSSPRECSPPDLVFAHPSAVIADREEQRRAFFLQHDVDPGRLRVTEHIRQGFLKDTKNRRRLLLLQNEVFSGAIIPTHDTRASLKLLRLPFESRRQPEIVQDAGAQFRSSPSDDMYGRIKQTHHGSYLPPPSWHA